MMKRVLLILRALVALLVPGAFIDTLTDADLDLELSRNEQLRAAGPDRQQQHRQETRHVVVDRLRFLRVRMRKAMVFVASAVSVAIVVAWLLPTPRSPVLTAALVANSVFLFAWATLGRLGWAGQSWNGDTVVERLDQALFWGSYWFGTLCGVLAAT